MFCMQVRVSETLLYVLEEVRSGSARELSVPMLWLSLAIDGVRVVDEEAPRPIRITWTTLKALPLTCPAEAITGTGPKDFRPVV